MEASSLDNLSSTGYQALNFAVMIGAMIIAVTAAWLLAAYHKKKRKRKRKHHGHDRINPTRAELGGLPPPRGKARQTARDESHNETPFDP
jgi:ABC-type nickel/cobalt efflux system permease component RcnA